jgi:UDP-N-acetyl-2-amino-2-deoxyglucuronate dehydrogenase
MDEKYNIGIVGYSWAATAHIAAINATHQGQVTAVFSSRALDAGELSARHGCPIVVYSKLEAMLADPGIHVIDITSYPGQHARQFCLAARAGKHVIVEKPLAIEWTQILEMKRAVAETGIRTCVCFECRYQHRSGALPQEVRGGRRNRVGYRLKRRHERSGERMRARDLAKDLRR